MSTRPCALLPRASLLPLLVAAIAGLLASTPGLAQIRPPDAEELAVSAGSWQCDRYLQASGVATAGARAIIDAVEPFALGYVTGVGDAVGRPIAATAATERRVVEWLRQGCTADPGRSIRDVTLLAGRAATEPGSALAAGEGTATGLGQSGCAAWLSARAHGPATREDNWAEGYVNARFERAGRGLIPTARNRSRVLDRVAQACHAAPDRSLHAASRRAAEQALPSDTPPR